MTTRSFSHDGFTVTLSPVNPRVGYGFDHWNGEKIQVRYTIRDHGRVIFSGDDLHIGLFQKWDSTITVGTLAAFLARSEDDCDHEWWDALTDDQRAWCNSPRCMDFSSWGQDTEQRARARQHARMTRDPGLRWRYR